MRAGMVLTITITMRNFTMKKAMPKTTIITTMSGTTMTSIFMPMMTKTKFYTCQTCQDIASPWTHVELRMQNR